MSDGDQEVRAALGRGAATNGQSSRQICKALLIIFDNLDGLADRLDLLETDIRDIKVGLLEAETSARHALGR